MKKVIILQHDGGEMGNQLWNYASIYAYCLERGYRCQNWSFFEHARYFKNTLPESILLKLFFFAAFTRHEKRMHAYHTRIWRKLYRLFIVLPVVIFCRKQIVYSNMSDNNLYYLPPTAPTSLLLSKLEHSARIIYFSFVSGGVFRNPVGLKKHRESIVSYFSPNSQVEICVREFIDRLRTRYKILIGVHLRQTNYVKFKGGKFYIRQERVRDILQEYCKQKGYSTNDVCFVVASDDTIDKKLFNGLNIEISTHNSVEDLFILASCDAIIGSDSTFGNFASYYGDIPHIVMKNEPMDWEYYADKNNYFINKYFTVMLS